MLGFNNCSEARAFAFFNRFNPSAENAVKTILLGFLGGLRDITISPRFWFSELALG